LLFLDFPLFLVLLHKVSEDLVLFKLAVLLLLSSEVGDLNFDPSDLFALALLFFPCVLNIFVALADLLLELGDLVHLVVSHSQGCSVV
jgi:hypothetical protein